MRIIDLKSLEFASEPYIYETEIKDLLIIKRPKYKDVRGAFQEQFRKSQIEEVIGRKINLTQAQISWSELNVIRGIHFEPQDKIVTPLSGRAYCVYLDLRKDSKTFRETLSIEFDNTIQNSQLTTVFIPEGVGNSLCVYSMEGDSLPGDTIYQYSVSKEYDPKTAGIGIKYNDPELAINWPVANPILSDRDINLPSYREFLKKYR